MQLTLTGLSPRTSLDGSQPETTHSASFWARWWGTMPPSFQSLRADGGRTRVWLMDPNEPPVGGYSTPNISDFPNGADASLCSLREVLETGPLPRRYFLSPAACVGILRRAAKRGKALPEALKRALESQAARAKSPTR